MDTIVQPIDQQIARVILAERESRAWSQNELAKRTGLSKAGIGKIERGEVSASATTLVVIAGAFDLTLAGMLLKAEGEMPRLSRAISQPVWRDPETGYVRRQVFARPDHPLELAHVELPAGARLSYPAWTYAHIRQIIWVQVGQLVIIEDQERHELEAGDCLAFGSPCPIVLANEAGTPCGYLIALARR